MAAGAEAFEQNGNGYEPAGDAPCLPGTLFRSIDVDPAASLRALVDSELREAVVSANREDERTQLANVDGSGHEYWVDSSAGFSLQEQDALIAFLLSLDDDPAVLPASAQGEQGSTRSRSSARSASLQ